MSYKIIADSSCELPNNLVKYFDIDIIPVIIIKDDKQYLDNIDIDSDKVFEDMKNEIVYTTSQIPLNSYIDVFSKYAKDNIPVINVTMSSGISSTYETSKMAVNIVKEQYPYANIHTVDSKCCSFEIAIALQLMAIANKKGKSFEEIMDMLKFAKENTTVLFTVSDLKYLYRGGRISKTSAFIGNALNIKPILTVSKEGKLLLAEKVRTKKKVFSYIIDTIRRDISSVRYFETIQIVISQAMAQSTAQELKELIMSNFPIKEEQFLIIKTGATIGVHTGPESFYVFYLRKPVPEI